MSDRTHFVAMKNEIKFAVRFFRHVVREAIKLGVLNPRGKSKPAFLDEVHKWVLSLKDHPIAFSIDYRGKLLSHARVFFRSKEYHLSCLMYATWTEHWINGIIATRCDVLRIPDKERKDIIRKTSLEGKCTWVFRLLGVKPLPKVHCEKIRVMADHRNAFVHYKWIGQDGSDKKNINGENELIQEVKDYEKIIKYMHKYESEYMLDKFSWKSLNNPRAPKNLLNKQQKVFGG